MNSITKKYTVIKIERLYPFMYLIEFEPEQPIKIDIKPVTKPETDEEKYVLRMVQAMQKFGLASLQAEEHKVGSEPPAFRDNNLQIIVNKLGFNVGDEIELTIKNVGN